MTKLYRIVWYEGTTKHKGPPTNDKQALQVRADQLNDQYFMFIKYTVETGNEEEH